MEQLTPNRREGVPSAKQEDETLARSAGEGGRRPGEGESPLASVSQTAPPHPALSPKNGGRGDRKATGPVDPTRREVLAAFLGLPALLAAGCQSEHVMPPLPAGEVIGPSQEVGHRLRGGYRPTPAAEAWQKTPVVIVGGGVAGLSAAWRLQRAGFRDFRLLELESAPGGTSRSGSLATAPTMFPWGAHYLPKPLATNRGLITLLREMGIVEGADDHGEPIIGEQFLCRDPQERIFYRGQWYEGLYLHAGASPEDLQQFEAFQKEVARWADWRDAKGRRAFAIPMSTASDDTEVTSLDKITMAEWLDKHQWNSPRLRWLVNYACRDDYGMTVEQTSAWAGLFYFAARLKKGGDDAQPFITTPEGNGHLVAHLLKGVQSQVLLGQAVTDVAPAAGESGPVEVVSVEGASLATGSPRVQGYRADQVIFAAPQFLTRYLLRPYREDPPKHTFDFDYGAWMVANLFLKNRPAAANERGFPLAWDNVLYESPSLGYVASTHQVGMDHGPTVFTYYYPLCDASSRDARERLLSLDWSHWADVALTDLSRVHREIRSLTERVDVMRWGHAMVRPKPGFLWGASRRAAAEPYRSIYFAHSDLSGVPLFEEAFYRGVLAAEQVLAARGVKTETIL